VCLSDYNKEKSLEAWKEYKKSEQNAKGKIQKECASNLNDPNHQNEIFQIAKQMVKEIQDITGSNCFKGALGKVTVDEKWTKDSSKDYMEKLMNEENEWDHRILAEIKEGPADCIRIDDVVAAIKKMKRHKVPGLSGLVAEMIQATGDNGTQWLLDLCSVIQKEGSIPKDWKSSVILPIYKWKEDPVECGSYRGIKLLECAMKVVERILEHRIWQQIDDMQFGFMKVKEPLMPFLL